MAISQADRMGVFVLNRLSHVSHLSDVGLTDFVAIPFLGSPVDVGDAGLAHQIGERAFI